MSEAAAQAATTAPRPDYSVAGPDPFLAGDAVVVPPVPDAIEPGTYQELAARPVETLTLDELDAMHHYAGIGDLWFASERRAELAATAGRAADRLDALAYECLRLSVLRHSVDVLALIR